MERFSVITLAKRRVLSDLLLIYKLVNGLVDSAALKSKLSFNVPIRDLRLQNTFTIPFKNTNSGQNSPLCRMSRSFNQLSLGMEVFDSSIISYKKFVKTLV